MTTMTTTCCHHDNHDHNLLPSVSVRCPRAALTRVFFSCKVTRTVVLLSSVGSKFGELVGFFHFLEDQSWLVHTEGLHVCTAGKVVPAVHVQKII